MQSCLRRLWLLILSLALLSFAYYSTNRPVGFGRLSIQKGLNDKALLDVVPDATCMAYPEGSSLVTLVCNVAENSLITLRFVSSNQDNKWETHVYKKGDDMNEVKSVSGYPGDAIELSICSSRSSTEHPSEADGCRDMTIRLARTDVIPKGFHLDSLMKNAHGKLHEADLNMQANSTAVCSDNFINAEKMGENAVSGNSQGLSTLEGIWYHPIYNISIEGNGELVTPLDPHSISIKVWDLTKKEPIILKIDGRPLDRDYVQYELDGVKLGKAPLKAVLDFEKEHLEHVLTTLDRRTGKRETILINVKHPKKLLSISSNDSVLFSKPVTTLGDPLMDLDRVNVYNEHKMVYILLDPKRPFGVMNIELHRGDAYINGRRMKCKGFKVRAKEMSIDLVDSDETHRVEILKSKSHDAPMLTLGMLADTTLSSLLVISMVHTFFTAEPINPLSGVVVIAIFRLLDENVKVRSFWDAAEMWIMDHFQILVDSSAGPNLHSSLALVRFLLSSVALFLFSLMYMMLIVVTLFLRYTLPEGKCYNSQVACSKFADAFINGDATDFVTIHLFTIMGMQYIDAFVDTTRMYIIGYSCSPRAIFLLFALDVLMITFVQLFWTKWRHKGVDYPSGSCYHVLKNGDIDDRLSMASSTSDYGDILALNGNHYAECKNVQTRMASKGGNISTMKNGCYHLFRIKNVYNVGGAQNVLYSNIFSHRPVAMKHLEHAAEPLRFTAKLSLEKLKQASLMDMDLEVYIPRKMGKQNEWFRMDKERIVLMKLMIAEHAVLLFTVICLRKSKISSSCIIIPFLASSTMWIIMAIRAQNAADDKNYRGMLSEKIRGKTRVGSLAKFMVILAIKRLLSASIFIISFMHLWDALKGSIILIFIHSIVNSSFLSSFFLHIIGVIKNVFLAFHLLLLEIVTCYRFSRMKIVTRHSNPFGKVEFGICKIVRLCIMDTSGICYDVGGALPEKRLYVNCSLKYGDYRGANLQVYQGCATSRDVVYKNHTTFATIILRKRQCRDVQLPLLLALDTLETVTGHSDGNLHSVTFDQKDGHLCFTGPFITAGKSYTLTEEGIVTRMRSMNGMCMEGAIDDQNDAHNDHKEPVDSRDNTEVVALHALCTSIGELTFSADIPIDFSKCIMIYSEGGQKMPIHPPTTFVDFNKCDGTVTLHHMNLKVGASYKVEYTRVGLHPSLNTTIIADKALELRVPVESNFYPFRNYKVTRDDGMVRSIKLIDEVSEGYKFGLFIPQIMLNGMVHFVDPNYGVCSFEDDTFTLQNDPMDVYGTSMQFMDSEDDEYSSITQGSISLAGSYTNVGRMSEAYSESLDIPETKTLHFGTRDNPFLLTSGNHSLVPVTVVSRLHCKLTGEEYFRVIPQYDYFKRVIDVRTLKLELVNLDSDLDAYFMIDEMESCSRTSILDIILRFSISHLKSASETLRRFDEVSKDENVMRIVGEMDRLLAVEPVHVAVEHARMSISGLGGGMNGHNDGDYDGSLWNVQNWHPDHHSGMDDQLSILPIIHAYIDHIIVKRSDIRPIIHIPSKVSEWMAESSHVLSQTFNREASTRFLKRVLSSELLSPIPQAWSNGWNIHHTIREIILSGPAGTQDPLEGRYTFGFIKFEGKHDHLWVPSVVYLSVSLLQIQMSNRVNVVSARNGMGSHHNDHKNEHHSRHHNDDHSDHSILPVVGCIRVEVKTMRSQVVEHPLQVLRSRERASAPILTIFEPARTTPPTRQDHWNVAVRLRNPNGQRDSRSTYTLRGGIEFRH